MTVSRRLANETIASPSIHPHPPLFPKISACRSLLVLHARMLAHRTGHRVGTDSLADAFALLRRILGLTAKSSATADKATPTLEMGVLRCALLALGNAIRVTHRFDTHRSALGRPASAVLRNLLAHSGLSWRLVLPFLQNVLAESATHSTVLRPALIYATAQLASGRRAARKGDDAAQLDAALAFVAECAGADVSKDGNDDEVEDVFARALALPGVAGLRSQLSLIVTDAIAGMVDTESHTAAAADRMDATEDNADTVDVNNDDVASPAHVARLWCAAASLRGLSPVSSPTADADSVVTEASAAEAAATALTAAIDTLHHHAQALVDAGTPLPPVLATALGTCLGALDAQRDGDLLWLTADTTTALYDTLLECYPTATPVLAAVARHYRALAALADTSPEGGHGESKNTDGGAGNNCTAANSAAAATAAAAAVLAVARGLRLLTVLAPCLHSGVAGQRRWALECLSCFDAPAWEKDERVVADTLGELRIVMWCAIGKEEPVGREVWTVSLRTPSRVQLYDSFTKVFPSPAEP